eukprot:1184879-Prorocentrum_minimum.AAC.2
MQCSPRCCLRANKSWNSASAETETKTACLAILPPKNSMLPPVFNRRRRPAMTRVITEHFTSIRLDSPEGAVPGTRNFWAPGRVGTRECLTLRSDIPQACGPV